MVEVQPPHFQDGQCYTWSEFRQVFGSIICVDGVVNADDLLVTAVGGASVNVSVAAGSAWIEGSLNSADGIYHVTNDAAKVMTITANGAGVSRTDLIIASVYDSQYIGGVDQWALEVITGVAGGGVPAVPLSTRSGYIVLAEVEVPATGGTPSVVADVRQYMFTCGTNPMVVIRASSATTLPAGSETQIELSTIEYQDTEFFDTSTPDQVGIIQNGRYDVWGEIAISETLPDTVSLNVYNDSADVAAARSAGGTSGWIDQATQLSVFLEAGAFLWLWSKQDDASPHDATAGRLLIRKVG
jgi:hypothetical protein